MSVESLKKEITQKQAEIKQITAELDDLAKQICDVAKAFFPSWYEDQARSAVASDAEKAKALGSEGLGQMKAEVRNAVQSVPAAVDHLSANKEAWDHRQSRQPSLKEMEELRYQPLDITATLEAALRTLTEPVGTILAKYGLADTGTGGSVGLWKLVRQIPGQSPIYGYAINFIYSSPLEKVVIDYRKSIGRLYQTKMELAKLEESLSKQEAADLYDSL